MKQPKFIQIKAALSLDGALDDASEMRRVFSSSEDREAVDALRAQFDAILIGAETLRKDNPRLGLRAEAHKQARRQAGQSAEPLKVVLTTSGRISESALFFQEGEGEKLIYCGANVTDALRARFSHLAQVVALPEDNALGFLLDDLANRGVERLLVEGGASIHRLFLEANVVQKMRLAYAPEILNQVGVPRFPEVLNRQARWQLLSTENIGGTLVLEVESCLCE